MGRPKATITIGGLTLIERLALAVGGAGLGEPIVVGGDQAWAGAFRWTPDLHPGEGPLGGLLSAFHSTTECSVFLLACDLVTPDRDAMAELAVRFKFLQSATDAADALVPVGERREVLHAIYSRRLQVRLRRSFDEGNRSLERALKGANVVEVERGEVRGLDASLRDADTPESLSTYGAGNDLDYPAPAMDEPVPGVDVSELAELLRAGAHLIDVREPHEYDEVRVPGAVLIPLATVADRVQEVPDGPVYIICAAGGRSHRAAILLRAQGKDAINVLGGTGAWVGAGLPTESGGA